MLRELFKKGKTLFSFEFFPPKTEKGWNELYKTIRTLSGLNPDYVSVTYGAGGSTRDNTHKLVLKIRAELGIDVVAHLTCVGTTKEEILNILNTYDKEGIHNILALRGDIPPVLKDHPSPYKDFPHASDLVAFIKEHFPHMCVGAAAFPEGHPETPNRLKEMEYLKEKVDTGVDFLVTQLFFDNRDYYDFCERCRLTGIDVPIVAGIMPITNPNNMQRMAELAAGMRYPAKLLKSLARAGGNSEGFFGAGVHWAAEQIRDLLDNNVPGIHIYTLNNSRAALAIANALGVENFTRL
ncbi:methylenetetrahydrofolate reductase [NAD(P)H] [Spirochaetia bacterium 38H-sp]|uniref:Methylenetetrahydrofolate reductase n=1 Tax=Rarispira pelagica TaxID=3141764 RepID=A0ABU9U9M8_9SPIR